MNNIRIKSKDGLPGYEITEDVYNYINISCLKCDKKLAKIPRTSYEFKMPVEAAIYCPDCFKK